MPESFETFIADKPCTNGSDVTDVMIPRYKDTFVQVFEHADVERKALAAPNSGRRWGSHSMPHAPPRPALQLPQGPGQGYDSCNNHNTHIKK